MFIFDIDSVKGNSFVIFGWTVYVARNMNNIRFGDKSRFVGYLLLGNINQSVSVIAVVVWNEHSRPERFGCYFGSYRM